MMSPTGPQDDFAGVAVAVAVGLGAVVAVQATEQAGFQTEDITTIHGNGSRNLTCAPKLGYLMTPKIYSDSKARQRSPSWPQDRPYTPHGRSQCTHDGAWQRWLRILT